MTDSAADPTAARLLDAAIHSLRTDILPLLGDDVARMRVDHITRLLRTASMRLTQRQASLALLVGEASRNGIEIPAFAGEPSLDQLEQQRHAVEDTIAQHLPALLDRIDAGDAQALHDLD